MRSGYKLCNPQEMLAVWGLVESRELDYRSEMQSNELCGATYRSGTAALMSPVQAVVADELVDVAQFFDGWLGDDKRVKIRLAHGAV